MDFYIPIPGTDRHIYLQLCKENELHNAEAMVVFDSTTHNTLSVETTYCKTTEMPCKNLTQTEDTENDITKSSLQTTTINSTSSGPVIKICSSAQPPILKNSIITSLHLAERNGLRSVAFPRIPHNGDEAEMFACCMIEAFADFIQCYRPVCLHTILAHDYEVCRYKTAAVDREHSHGDVTRGGLFNNK